MTKDRTIFIKNIYYMLCYAFTNLKFEDIKKVSAEEFENIHNLLAAVLSEGISKQLKQGLYREYLNKTENLATLRGKIDMPGTMQNITAGRRKFFCEFDELSENNLFNQILKTTAKIFLRHREVKEQYKNLLKQELYFFANVEEVNPAAIRWDGLCWRRNNLTYQMLINFCRLVLEGMLITTDDGEYKLKSFRDAAELHSLYEKFLLAYYAKHFPHLKPKSAQIDWALDDGEKNLLPTMRSDIMLSSGDKVLIIDAKYYAETLKTYHGAKKISSDNLYQIFAYVKNFAYNTTKKVSGMLLYARTDEDIQPDNTYSLSGNKISVQTLDLNKDFFEIDRQLKNIVAENFGG